MIQAALRKVLGKEAKLGRWTQAPRDPCCRARMSGKLAMPNLRGWSTNIKVYLEGFGMNSPKVRFDLSNGPGNILLHKGKSYCTNQIWLSSPLLAETDACNRQNLMNKRIPHWLCTYTWDLKRHSNSMSDWLDSMSDWLGSWGFTNMKTYKTCFTKKGTPIFFGA